MPRVNSHGTMQESLDSTQSTRSTYTMMDLRWDILAGYGPLFAEGVITTIELTLVAIVAGLALGIAFGLISSSVNAPPPRSLAWAWALKVLRGITTAYVTFFRGTPLFVQILLVHFALMPALIHPDSGWLLSGDAARTLRQEHGAFFSGCLALSLNAGAYISEIFRAGIQSIHLGQTQAGYSLGLTHAQSMRYVILLSAIGLAELALAARTVAGAYSRYWEPYLAISAIYLVLTLVLSTLAKRLETPAYQRGR